MTVDTHGARKPRRRFGAPKNWRTTFLGALAETSNVKASAELADISQSWVYKTRREDQEFARQWLEALCEGYDNLEMDLVHRLRNGEIRDADGRKFDNAAAIRLLALHKADVARARALRDDLTEQAVLASIDAMLDAMRERTAANTGDDAIGPGDDGA
jgi:hypothetical protein